MSQSTKQSTYAGIISSITESQPPESSGCTMAHNDITQWFGAEKAELKSQEVFYGRENNIGLHVSSQWSRSNALVLAEADEELVVAFSSQSFGATPSRRSYLLVYNRTCFVLQSYLKILVQTASMLCGCG